MELTNPNDSVWLIVNTNTCKAVDVKFTRTHARTRKTELTTETGRQHILRRIPLASSTILPAS